MPNENFWQGKNYSPAGVVGASASVIKPLKPFRPMVGEKSSLIWILGGSVGKRKISKDESAKSFHILMRNRIRNVRSYPCCDVSYRLLYPV